MNSHSVGICVCWQCRVGESRMWIEWFASSLPTGMGRDPPTLFIPSFHCFLTSSFYFSNNFPITPPTPIFFHTWGPSISFFISKIRLLYYCFNYNNESIHFQNINHTFLSIYKCV